MAEPSLSASKGVPSVIPADRGWLCLLLLLFLSKGLFLVFLIAPFTGHDEVDHFDYIRRMATGAGLGEMGVTRLPDATAPYAAYVADFPYNSEVIQPPLYHVLMTPAYWFSPGGDVAKLRAVRCVSLLLGLAVVLVAYQLARVLYPADFGMRAGVPIFVALQPQFAFEAAIVNHDILVILLASLVALVLCRGLPVDRAAPSGLPLTGLLAAGLWTKPSFGLMLPLVALGLVFAGRNRSWSAARIVRSIAAPYGGALLLASPWFIRSWLLYGDPTGARRLHEIPLYGAQAQTVPDMIFSGGFWQGLLEDFWGNYGWRLIPFDPYTYRAIYLLWLPAALGLVLSGALLAPRRVRRRGGSPSRRVQQQGMTLMAAWVLLMLAGVVYVGTIQFTQARFAFPGMIGFAMLSIFGYRALMPDRLRTLIPPLVFAAMLSLNVVTTVRFMLPFYWGAGPPAAAAP